MTEINGVTIELHADDYGQTLNTTKDILELIKEGRLDGISILPNMPSSDEAVRMLEDAIRNKEIPFLPLMSIHLDLVEGRMISARADADASEKGNAAVIPWTWKKLFFASYHLAGIDRAALKEEIRAQLIKGQQAVDELQKLAEENGVAYTPQKVRIDSHQHAHMIPMVWKYMVQVIDEEHFEIEYIRNSHEPLSVFNRHSGRDTNWNKVGIVKNRVLAVLAPRVEKYMAGISGNCGTAPVKQMYLWGLIMTGHMDMDRIRIVMPDMIAFCKKNNRNLELNIHPGLMLESEMCPEVPEESARDFYLLAENRGIEAQTAREFHEYLQSLN